MWTDKVGMFDYDRGESNYDPNDLLLNQDFRCALLFLC